MLHLFEVVASSGNGKTPFAEDVIRPTRDAP